MFASYVIVASTIASFFVVLLSAPLRRLSGLVLPVLMVLSWHMASAGGAAKSGHTVVISENADANKTVEYG